MRASLPDGAEIRRLLRLALGCALSWWTGRLLGAPRPVFAVLAVILCLQGNPFGALRLAGLRLAGVLAGVALGAAALRVPAPPSLLVGALVLAAAALGGRLRLGGQLHSQAAISALLVLAVGRTWPYGLDRLWETALGGAVAVAVSAALWPVHPLRAYRADLLRLWRSWGAALPALAAAFAGGDPGSGLRRRLRRGEEEAHRRLAELPALEEALGWNPWQDRRALNAARDEAGCLAALHRHAASLARLAADPGRRLSPEGAAALRRALGALGGAASALGSGRVAEAGGLLAAADGELGAVAHGCPGSAWVGPAAAGELGHIGADLRALLAAGGERRP